MTTKLLNSVLKNMQTRAKGTVENAIAQHTKHEIIS